MDYAKDTLFFPANIPGSDYAGDLLDAFVTGSTTVPTAITTTGIPLSAAHPSLTHPVGAIWNPACQVNTLRFTFPDGVEASDDFEESNALLQIINQRVYDNLSALLADGEEDWKIKSSMIFSHFVNFAETEFGGVEVNELNLAFGRVTVNGSMGVKYRLLSPTSIEVSEVEVSGSFDDLYDFDYASGGNARLASVVQAGHATVAPPIGRVVFTRLEFTTGWRPHPRIYP